MSDASQFNNPSPGRALREDERNLIGYLLTGVYPAVRLESVLATARVTDMHDGGMGGIRFVAPEPRTLGKAIAETQYLDGDGVLVSIVINMDSNGRLFELDFWKVDFSPLRRYPRPVDLLAKK